MLNQKIKHSAPVQYVRVQKGAKYTNNVYQINLYRKLLLETNCSNKKNSFRFTVFQSESFCWKQVELRAHTHTHTILSDQLMSRQSGEIAWMTLTGKQSTLAKWQLFWAGLCAWLRVVFQGNVFRVLRVHPFSSSASGHPFWSFRAPINTHSTRSSHTDDSVQSAHKRSNWHVMKTFD